MDEAQKYLATCKPSMLKRHRVVKQHIFDLRWISQHFIAFHLPRHQNFWLNWFRSPPKNPKWRKIVTAGRAGEDSDVLRSFERRGGPACAARVPARPERGRQASLGKMLTLTPPCMFNTFCTNILIVCSMFLPCNRWLRLPPTVVPWVLPATLLQSAVVCKEWLHRLYSNKSADSPHVLAPIITLHYIPSRRDGSWCRVPRHRMAGSSHCLAGERSLPTRPTNYTGVPLTVHNTQCSSPAVVSGHSCLLLSHCTTSFRQLFREKQIIVGISGQSLRQDSGCTQSTMLV